MKRILIFALLLTLLAAFAVPAAAATVEETFATLDQAQDIVIWVAWEVEQPVVTFVGPDDTVYDPLTDTEGAELILSEYDLYYVIHNAPAGDWRVRYDKLGNESLTISMHPYTPGPAITDYTLGEVSGNRLNVSFYVEDAKDRNYDYTLSIATGKNGPERELAAGSASTNREVNTYVYLDEMGSYTDYLLKLYVFYQEDGVDYFDVVYSEPFAYVNESVSSAMTDFELCVYPEEALITVAWPEIDWNADSVLVALFEDGADQPLLFDEYAPDRSSLELSYDPAATEVRIELSVSIGGVYTDRLSKTFDPNACVVALPEMDAVNSLALPLTYHDCIDQTVEVAVGEQSASLQLDGDGSLELQLLDGWNDVLVRLTDSEGVTWVLDRKIYVDRVAPLLRMSERYDGLQTEQTQLQILGTVEDYATLSVNGTVLTPEAGGAFTYTMQLDPGENTLLVIAADAIGNEAQYQAVITRTSGLMIGASADAEDDDGAPSNPVETVLRSGWLLLAITGGLGLLVVLYALIFWRRRKEGEQ